MVLGAFFGIFAKPKNFHKYKIFCAFSPWPPVNIRAITGRSWGSWADHGRQAEFFKNYAQIVSNPYIITSAEVVPRNEEGPLRTWPLLIVILRISSTHFLQRVRVKNSKSGALEKEKPQDRVKPLLGPNFRNIERKR